MIINRVEELTQQQMQAKLDFILHNVQPLSHTVSCEGSLVTSTFETQFARVVFESDKATIKVCMRDTGVEYLYQHNVNSRDTVEYIHAKEFWNIYLIYKFGLAFAKVNVQS